MEGGLLLDVVVAEGAAVFELLASEDEALLVRRDAFLVLNLGLDVLNGVTGLHVEGDGLAGEGLHEDLHVSFKLIILPSCRGMILKIFLYILTVTCIPSEILSHLFIRFSPWRASSLLGTHSLLQSLELPCFFTMPLSSKQSILFP